MTIERQQITVRTMLKAELLECQHTGKKFGHKTIIKPETIRAEIERRIANTTDYYGAWGIYNMFGS